MRGMLDYSQWYTKQSTPVKPYRTHKPTYDGVTNHICVVRKWAHQYWSSRCTEQTTYMNSSDSFPTIYPCLSQSMYLVQTVEFQVNVRAALSKDEVPVLLFWVLVVLFCRAVFTGPSVIGGLTDAIEQTCVCVKIDVTLPLVFLSSVSRKSNASQQHCSSMKICICIWHGRTQATGARIVYYIHAFTQGCQLAFLNC